MYKTLKLAGMGVVLASTAIISGTLVGFASTPMIGNVDILQKTIAPTEPGNLTVDGTVTIDTGKIVGKPIVAGVFTWNSVTFGDGTAPPEFRTNMFGINLDVLSMGSGEDNIDFGPENAAIRYESSFYPSPPTYDDSITYTAGSGTDNDLLTIRSDDLVFKTNKGDVVVRLGN